ncbi:MAG: hypothetical protein QF807_00135 [Candidatus Thalassarchaeaceae archaeon]|nr:hypothetical protein [Candidatus Thalassarchaeaceae archaeon]MDP7042415.1 hypothetical protein [Candidatus Thalassarchaeaceae archaeon]
MMVRIMSVLPLLTGALCVLLVLVGAIGYTSNSETVEVPIPPCIPGSDDDCEVGMNQDNLSVPQPFMLLDVTVEMHWDHGDDAWIGVVDVDSIDWDNCGPDDQGLTGCTASQFDIIAGGPTSQDGLEWDLDPGETRFITGGRAGTLSLESNVVTYTYSIGMATLPMLILGVIGVVLCLAGVQMAFPVKFSRRENEDPHR